MMLPPQAHDAHPVSPSLSRFIAEVSNEACHTITTPLSS
uniref:Uncharacterized protein n=1 Tax=Moniliophthora roreri TaxID=221103 RepID=A0A0W0FDF9_MONRR